MKIQNIIPNLWYKDPKRLTNCINLIVSVYNHENQPVSSRLIPLIFTLYYEKDLKILKPVDNQDLLKIMNPNFKQIENSSQVENSFRIEDVSRNHEGYNFVVKVEPDNVSIPRNNDIAYTFTNPIKVKSKPKTKAKTKTKTKREYCECDDNPSKDICDIYNENESKRIRFDNNTSQLSSFTPENEINKLLREIQLIHER